MFLWYGSLNSQEFTSEQIKIISNRNQYKCIIEGVDNPGADAKNRQYVSYPNLPAGKYVCRLTTANSLAIWNDSEVSVLVNINPPFWDTWYFKLFAFVACASSIYIMHLAKVKRILGLAKARERVSRDLHNEMGSNLSTINILVNVARATLAEKNERERAIQLLDKIKSLSAKVVETVDEVNWSTDPRNDSMDEITKRMRLLGSHLEDFNINFSFIIEGNIANCKLDIERRSHLYLMYKEVITNIGKHSKCKNATVHFIFKETIELTVVDDGIGFNISSFHRGNGLQNIQTRGKKINARVSIGSEPGKRTMIKIIIPK